MTVRQAYDAVGNSSFVGKQNRVDRLANKSVRSDTSGLSKKSAKSGGYSLTGDNKTKATRKVYKAAETALPPT